MKNRFILLILIFGLLQGFLYSEEEVAIPYKRDEFPQWTLDLRRAEIVTIGSLPLSFMFTALAYDVYKSAASGFDPQVPFGSSRTQDDIIKLLVISSSVSLAIGITDFIIHQVKRSNTRKEKERLDEQRKAQSNSSR